MKNIFFIAVLALAIVACGDGNAITGNTVASEDSFLEQEVARLQAALTDAENLAVTKEQLAAAAENAKAVAETKLADLQEEVRVLQNTVDSQKIIMKEMDNEREEAVSDQEGCDERIESLENSNKKLQDMLDICQEDLN